MTIRNAARERLERGELSLGLGLRLARSVDIAKILKSSGYDFLFIDLEHGSQPVSATWRSAMTASSPFLALFHAGAMSPLASVRASRMPVLLTLAK